MLNVRLTYFKDSGKYYAHGFYNTNKPHMFAIFDEVESMRDSGEVMPGLVGTWSGPILVDVEKHPNNHPCLIMPVEKS